MKGWILPALLVAVWATVAVLLLKPERASLGGLLFDKPAGWTWERLDRLDHPVAVAPALRDGFVPSVNLVQEYYDNDLAKYIAQATELSDIVFWEVGATNIAAVATEAGLPGRLVVSRNDRFPKPLEQRQYFFQTNETVFVLTYTRPRGQETPRIDEQAEQAVRSFRPPTP